MPDTAYLEKRARACRKLASQDPAQSISESLLDLALLYERQAQVYLTSPRRP